MVKKLVNIQAFLKDNTNMTYKGRLLGLLTEEEYAGLVTQPDLMRKLFSVGSKPLQDISDAKVDVEDMRLAITVMEKDDEAILTPTLFVTDPLEMISSVVDNKCINLNGKNSTFYIVEEEVTQ